MDADVDPSEILHVGQIRDSIFSRDACPLSVICQQVAWTARLVTVLSQDNGRLSSDVRATCTCAWA